MIKLKTSWESSDSKERSINSKRADGLKTNKKDRLDLPSLKAFKSRLNLLPAFLGKYILV